VAKADYVWPKSRKCLFRWTRDSLRSDWYGNYKKIKCSVTVPMDELFNVDAYTPGDYHQFYDDPRTREEYLEWAPLLLAAEDYHAGKLKIRG